MQSVLDLRRRAEDRAATGLADATRAAADADAEDARRAEGVARASARWAQARDAGATDSGGGTADRRGAGGRVPAPAGAHALADHERFVERLRDELRQAQLHREQFRDGPWTAAQQAVDRARAAHRAARAAREVLEKHAARHAAAAKLVNQRREEDAQDDIARAAAGLRRDDNQRQDR